MHEEFDAPDPHGSGLVVDGENRIEIDKPNPEYLREWLLAPPQDPAETQYFPPAKAKIHLILDTSERRLKLSSGYGEPDDAKPYSPSLVSVPSSIACEVATGVEAFPYFDERQAEDLFERAMGPASALVENLIEIKYQRRAGYDLDPSGQFDWSPRAAQAADLLVEECRRSAQTTFVDFGDVIQVMPELVDVAAYARDATELDQRADRLARYLLYAVPDLRFVLERFTGRECPEGHTLLVGTRAALGRAWGSLGPTGGSRRWT